MTIKYEDYIEKQREEGRQEGELKMAQKFAIRDGIEKASEISGFTVEEIETGQLQPSK